MDLDVRELRYLVAVDDAGSISAAARRLRVAQPALSRTIARAEAHLGFALFLRGARVTTPTAAGGEFLASARSVIRSAEELRRVGRVLSAGGATGKASLRVGASPSVATGLIAGAMRAADVAVDLSILPTTRQAGAVVAGTVDVVFGRARPADYGACVDAVPVGEEPLVAALPRVSAAASGAPVGADQLATSPLLMYPRAVAPAAYDAVLAVFTRAGRVADPIHMGGSDLDLLGLVACGSGITIVPGSMRALRHPAIVYRDLRDVAARTPVSAAVASNVAEPTREIADRLIAAVSGELGLQRGPVRRDAELGVVV
ncbi:MAG: LysR family transcriptional regulator [Microbacterium sp.]